MWRSPPNAVVGLRFRSFSRPSSEFAGCGKRLVWEEGKRVTWRRWEWRKTRGHRRRLLATNPIAAIALSYRLVVLPEVDCSTRPWIRKRLFRSYVNFNNLPLVAGTEISEMTLSKPPARLKEIHAEQTVFLLFYYLRYLLSILKRHIAQALHQLCSIGKPFRVFWIRICR